MQQARSTPAEELLLSTGYDYLTSCYFDAFSADENLQKRSAMSLKRLKKYLHDALPTLYRQLGNAGIVVSMQPKKIPEVSGRPSSQADISSALQSIEKENTIFFNTCLNELHYLANVLMAGDNSAGEQLSPAAAAEKTMGICQNGIHHVLAPFSVNNPESVKKCILDHGLVKLFRVGWNITAKS